MLDKIFKRTIPLLEKNWIKQRLKLSVGIILFVLLFIITLTIFFNVTITIYLGSFFVILTYLLEIICISLHPRQFYDYYVAVFKKDTSIPIDRIVIVIYSLGNFFLFIGVCIILFGTLSLFFR